ncbi:MAG TPA: YdcF family protein [Planctomycetota bacterium]|jgi:vancomycin permeability regulator SanA
MQAYRKLPLAFRRVVFALLLAAFIFLATTVWIVYDGLSDRLAPCDVAVVLGNKVEADGSPSRCLQARLDQTLALFRQGYCPKVIVSGGKGATGYSEPVAMRQYLVERGVPGDCIIMDEDGVNTFGTARSTARIMKEAGMRRVMVVTQYFHIARSKLALHKFGVREIYCSHARFCEWRDVPSTIREVIGYYFYLLRPTS